MNHSYRVMLTIEQIDDDTGEIMRDQHAALMYDEAELVELLKQPDEYGRRQLVPMFALCGVQLGLRK